MREERRHRSKDALTSHCPHRSDFMSPINVLIIGAGAIGAFYASRLATVPTVKVSVICRSNYKAVKAGGFKVSSPYFGDYTFIPENTFRNPAEASKSRVRWHYILVSTKALPDVSDDSEILEPLIEGVETTIVLIQNGLGVEAPYVQRFPNTVVLSGVTITSAAQPDHGIIKHNRWTRISIGPYLDATHGIDFVTKAEERNKQFVSLLTESGIRDAETYDHANLQLLRWHKIAINASMNPTSVLTGGMTNNAMSFDPEGSRHILAVIQEVLDTAPKVLRRPLPKKFATADQILQSTQKNKSGSVPSMQLDWQSGKKMELEVILGNPIRIAREHGIDMPRMHTLYALLKMAQAHREKATVSGGKESKL